MVDITVIDKRTQLQRLVDDVEHEGDKRTYVGMSSIGHHCMRYLWYQFRWCYTDKFNAQLMRLFDRGHREEPAIIAELRKIGVVVSGEQTGYIGCNGHYRGHNDGVAENVPDAPKTPHILEMKTINDKGYKELCKKGLEVGRPVYYAQCQAYMKAGKYSRALFIAVNKNTDAWYVERVRYDKGYAEDLTRKAEWIITNQVPFKKTLPPGWYACQWCAAKYVCNGSDKPEVSCRSCKHAGPIQEGKWYCTLYKGHIPTKFQRVACKDYECYEI